MTTNLVKIPTKFYCDHLERDLPTPEIVKSSRTHFWIDLNDSALGELLNDAEFYAEIAADMGSEYLGLASSARATAKAINKAIQS